MRFYCNGQDLANASNIVSKALFYKRGSMALEGIRLFAKDDYVILSAYSQELFIEKKIKAEVLVDGDCVTSGKLFNDYVNKLNSQDKVEIEKDGEKIKIMFNECKGDIPCFDIEKFPVIDDSTDEDTNEITIKENEFKDLVERVLFCVAMNDNRMLLRCCNMQVKGDIIEAVCLDGYRVAVNKKAIIGNGKDFKIIVLGKIIGDLLKIIENGEEPILLKVKSNSLYVSFEKTKVKISTTDSDLYNYSRLEPSNNKKTVLINKEEIENCLDRAAIISKDNKANKVSLYIYENKINIQSESEISRFDDYINCKYDGEELRMAFNCRFLQDSIARIKEDIVSIDIENSSKPVVIKSLNDDGYKCYVLPLRLIG